MNKKIEAIKPTIKNITLNDINRLVAKCERLEKENEEFKKLHAFLFPRQHYKTTLHMNFMEQLRKLQRVMACAEDFIKAEELDGGYFEKEYDEALDKLKQSTKDSK